MAAGVALGAAAAFPPGVAASRLCCVPYVGSPTPEVLADGLLQTSIAWGALIADTPRCAAVLAAATETDRLGSLPRLAAEAAAAAAAHDGGSGAKAAVAALLVCALRSLNITDIVEGHRRAAAAPTTGSSAIASDPQPSLPLSSPRACPPVLAAVLAVSASDDWYLLPQHAVTLHDALAPIAARTGPAELEWVTGGHAAAHLTRGTHQIAAITWALDAVAERASDAVIADVGGLPQLHHTNPGAET